MAACVFFRACLGLLAEAPEAVSYPNPLDWEGRSSKPGPKCISPDQKSFLEQALSAVGPSSKASDGLDLRKDRFLGVGGLILFQLF